MKRYNNEITCFQYMYIIQGAMIGVGILSLSSSVCKSAQQSGWISVLLGGIYPVYIVIVSSLIYKNMRYINFYDLNKKIYGKYISYISYFIFILYFIFFSALILSGFTNVLTFSTVKFLPSYMITAITSFAIYISINYGLTYIGRLSEIIFPLTILLLLIPLYFINMGDITNLLPLISSYEGIIKAMPDTLFSYSGIEICFLIIPFISKKKNIIKYGIIGSIITIIMYTVTVLLIINYCGWKLTSKLQYPFLYLVAGADIPVLSNFEPIFIFFWGNKVFQTISACSFTSSYLISQSFNIDYNYCSLIVCVLIFLTSFFLIPESNRSKIINISLPYMIITIFLWSLLTLLLSYIKRGASK
ncbi:hypothetical protein FDN13_05215 [Caloramator sp. E03]|uniref:GerAB/ArcD/ProY family transporter n=1 Tax=Caloramator sp. E03 TaxID=2576307 RepID=UPI001110BEA0|nr:endospore germination permease [Caloramator sp. E03]QCX33147.1 hypothetical protein FDN13_05215 [Caloramator sp. E03]